MSTAKKETDIRLEAWGMGRSHPDAVLLLELRYALETMEMGIGVVNPRMLMSAARMCISRMEEYKNKTQE